MQDEEPIEINTSLIDTSSARRSTYDRLVGKSKKLGRGAMKGFHGVVNMLHQEHPRTERFLRSFPRSGGLTTKQKELRAAEQLKTVVKKSHEVLGSAQTVFPITLFPDSIVVDRTKISITKRDFFWSSNVISFQIQDVLNVSCGVGPLFGSLTIASRVMSSVDHFQIDHLWRGDAIYLKHLIQGHIIAKNNMLATDGLTKEEMIETLCELGIDSDR